jgi:hypothetical protein
VFGARARGGVGFGFSAGMELCKTEVKCSPHCWGGTQ